VLINLMLAIFLHCSRIFRARSAIVKRTGAGALKMQDMKRQHMQLLAWNCRNRKSKTWK